MVRRDGVRKFPRIGTRVRVPFGLGKAEGKVVDTYEGARGPRVEVEVDLGYGASVTTDVALDDVEVTDAA
jgi:hypothetical protein